MKRFKVTALLAAAGMALFTSSASAAIYVNGDIFLGFRASGGAGASQSYLINIGQASTFRDLDVGASLTLNLGNIGPDLVGIYGPNWFNRADLFWGVAGAISPALNSGLMNDPNFTIYASALESPAGTPNIPYNRRSNSQQSGTTNAIGDLRLTYTPQTGTTNSGGRAVIETEGDPILDDTWKSFQPGGVGAPGDLSFSAFSQLEGNFGGGTANTGLSLIRLQTSPTANIPGTYEGSFGINDAGVVTFTNPIPEPVAATSLALGLAALASVRRRRSMTA